MKTTIAIAALALGALYYGTRASAQSLAFTACTAVIANTAPALTTAMNAAITNGYQPAGDFTPWSSSMTILFCK